MSGETELISVILPAYNREATLKRAIESVMRQSFGNWELILVDDGSTDDTGNICEEYAQLDSRIKAFHTDHSGVSHARNVGLDKAQGEWMAFIDSDDEYVANAFEAMMECSLNSDVIAGAILTVPQCKAEGLLEIDSIALDSHYDGNDPIFAKLLLTTVWGKLFKRTSILGIRFAEGIQNHEDTIYFRDVVKSGPRITYVPMIVYHYFFTGKSLAHSFFLSGLADKRNFYEHTVARFGFPAMVESAKRNVVSYAVNFFRILICDDAIGECAKCFTVQLQLEDNIAGLDFSIEGIALPPVFCEAWNVLRTGDAENVIAWFGENDERIRHAYAKEEDEESEIPPNSFIIQLAGITIEVRHRYGMIKEKCRDYLVQTCETPGLSAYAPLSKIEFSKQYQYDSDKIIIDDAQAEYDALPYRFYGMLPQYDAFWLHAVVIEKDGKAYAFSAQPGIGKSTHAALWLKAFSDARIINGDNPIVRLNPADGKFYAYGTPFCGKEGYNENRGVLLKAVIFLERGEENEIHQVKGEFVLVRLMKDNFCINAENSRAHYELYQRFIGETEFYSLRCNMEIEAAEIAYGELSKNG